MDTVLGILRKETPHALDARCVEALADEQVRTTPVTAGPVAEEPVTAT
jgi:hypothetical protein